MWIYLSSFLSCYIVGISKQRNVRVVEFLLLFFLAIFLCSGFMCGSDWRNYEIMYNDIDLDNYFFGYFAEPGFYVYLSIFKFFNFDFWDVVLITKLTCFCIIVHFLKKRLCNDVLIGLMYFLPWYAFYLFIDCPMRNLMAISIFLLAVPFLLKRKFLSYLLVMIIAANFHVSAIVFILLYFVGEKGISNKKSVFLFLIINFVFASRAVVIKVVSILFGGVPYLSTKVESYLLENNEFAAGRIISFGMIIHLIFLFLLLWKRKSIEEAEHGGVIFNFALFYLLLYRLATTIEVFGRFQLYLAPFFCIALVLIARSFNFQNRLLFVTYLLCISFVGSIKIFSDYRYIPYTSYLPYILEKDYPSFEYRDAYNFKNSPYAVRK